MITAEEAKAMTKSVGDMRLAMRPPMIVEAENSIKAAIERAEYSVRLALDEPSIATLRENGYFVKNLGFDGLMYGGRIAVEIWW